MINNQPVNARDIRDQSLGQEDLLEEGLATHSSVPAWRIPWTEEPGGLQSCLKGRKESDTTEATEHAHTHACNVEENGNFTPYWFYFLLHFMPYIDHYTEKVSYLCSK